MDGQTSLQTATANIRAAIEAGRRDEARILAAALRTQFPDEVEGWLWSTWLSELPVDALRFAHHAAELAPSAATDQALDWARSRLRAAMAPPSDAELLQISDSLPALSQLPSTGPVEAVLPLGPAGAEAPEGLKRPAVEKMATPRRADRAGFRLYDAVLLVALVILAALAAWLLLEQAATPDAARAAAPSQPELALKREAGLLWVAGDRLAALERWQEAHRLSPTNPDITESLARAHVAISTDYLNQNNPDAALPNLEAAYQLMPEEQAVVNEYQALRAYLAGREAVAAREWDAALAALLPLYALDRGYLDVAALVETAQLGQQQQAQEREAEQARALSQARRSEPGRAAREILTPTDISSQPGQTAMPSLGPFAGDSGKHIVVSINAQRMYVYENGQLIWNWTASTGEAARPTVPGRYRIQSKFENARSNVWSLWMPYWQGIYWAGGVENGIHGQVTFDAGGRLWEGYLGTRITFGCVMISDENAATLFNWTEMGTPVSIHWDWDPAWLPDANGDPM